MMDQPVGRLASGLLALGGLLVVLGVAELTSASPVFQELAAFVLLGIGAALVTGSVITLVVLVPLARSKKTAPEPGPQPPQIEVDLHDSPGTIVNPSAPVTQYFGVQPPALDKTLPSHWPGRPISLGAGFVGRESDIKAIADAFDTHNAIVVSGGAGSGKSRLAAEYTHQAKAPGFWTSAGSSVAETLVALGPALGVRMTKRPNEEIAGEVGRRLAEFEPETLWVIDNLDDIEMVNGLLSESGGVRVLITTRDSRSHLLPAAVPHHRTEVLSQEAAIDLLRSRSQSKVPADHPALAPIVEKVGRLPLALEVLAAQLGEARRTPKSILAQLNRAPTVIQMDAFQEASGASIPRPEAEGVFAAIAGTLEDLNPDDGLALAGLAYIADSPVPDPLAAALTGLDSESLTDLLSRCNRQSILSWSDGQVSVHALTVAALAATSQEDSLDVVRVRANIRLAQVNTDDLVALRAELVHYEAIHSQKLGRLGPDEEWLPSFGDDLATGYFALGRTDDAISLWERTLDLSEPVLGPEHPDTLTSRSNLANGYHAAGRTDDAIRLNEPTLEMRERVLGPEHPDTLRSNNNLAIAYFAAGRTDDAIRLGKQTFETMERVLGPEHPSTRTSRNNLAIGYRATGRIQDAERLESRE